MCLHEFGRCPGQRCRCECMNCMFPVLACVSCDGEGAWEECAICGNRLDECDHEHPDATHIVPRECDDCLGTGEIEVEAAASA